MNRLWSLEALLAAIGGKVSGDPSAAIGGISIDSRTVQAGDVFFAIRGERFDGHDYVQAALAAGAALAVVTEGRVPPNTGPVLAVADDPLDALVRLAIAARDRMDGAVVAVTGSVGKTGTKEMLKVALSPLGATHAPVGSFNNHWGVPLTLARMPAETDFGIFELGMNHAEEIRPLARLVRPHVAIVTTVEPVHLAHFSGEAEIAEAKAEIFDGLGPDGTAILNRDNRWFDLMADRARGRAKILSFGEHPAADIRLEQTKLDADGSEVEVSISGIRIRYRLGAPGRHLVQNSLAVVGAAHAIGADLGSVTKALGDFRAPKGRGERFRLAHRGGYLTLIDESYNANPASMRAALSLLAQAHPGGEGRRIAVLGDMLELGDEAETLHRGLLPAIEDSRADLVFLAGPVMESLWRDLPETCRGAYAKTGAELEPILLDAAGPGDVIMVKASLGTRLGPLVGALKARFAPEAA